VHLVQGSDVQAVKKVLDRVGCSTHLLLVDAGRLCCMPGHSFQSVLEHALTRGKDAVAIQEVGELGTDQQYGIVASSMDDAPNLAPQITQLTAAVPAADIVPGDWCVQPALVLTPSTLAAGHVQSCPGNVISIADLLLHLFSRAQLYGVRLGAGCWPAGQRALACLRFMSDSVVRPGDSWHEEDVTGTTDSDATGKATSSMQQQQQQRCAELMARFRVAQLDQGQNKIDLRLPDTFYMTTTRKQASDIMR
jgi:hypothetical protein